MRVVEPAEDDVRAAADVGRHRRLGSDVFPGLVFDGDFDAGRFGELLGVFQEFRLVTGDELRPPQDFQLGPFLGNPLLFVGSPGRSAGKAAGADQHAGRAKLEHITT